MDASMTAALTKMIEAGGSLAIWGIFVWQGIAWIKILTVSICVLLCVKAMAGVMFEVGKNK